MKVQTKGICNHPETAYFVDGLFQDKIYDLASKDWHQRICIMLHLGHGLHGKNWLTGEL